MKPRIHGRFADVGIPIRVRLLSGSGVPAGIGGRDHSHDFTELLVFHGGRGIHRVEEHDYPVTAGDVFVVTGDQTHAIVGRRAAREAVMLSLPSAIQIFLCREATDLRKGFDTLAARVQEVFGRDPLSGHLFVFPNRRRDRIKLLYWDRDGYAIWYKCLERGTFRVPADGEQEAEIGRRELSMMLEGVDLRTARTRTRFEVHKGAKNM